jgi:uncharacterized protein (TIGR02391 family)
MAKALGLFEVITRRAASFIELPAQIASVLHPFDERNVHPKIEKVSKKLFDDGHYSQATFEAFKLLDKEVQKLSQQSESGVKLMMKAFSETNPLIKLTKLSTDSEKHEQEGYKFMFAGSVMAIRNPRGHEVSLPDSPTQCLDHLSVASMLFRRLDEFMSVAQMHRTDCKKV